MSKFTKIFMKVMPVFAVVAIVASSVFGISPSLPTGLGGSKVDSVTNLANSVWSTLSVIIQILAIAAIVIAGVRYMFASANDKADIKKQTIVLVAGAALVFAAVPIAQFVAKAANDIIKP